MSDKLGAVAYDERVDSGQYGMGGHHEKKYSDDTAKEIDAEVRQILDEAHNAALAIVKEHAAELELMTQMLIEFETLDSEDIEKIVTNKWDIEEKRAKLKRADDLHKKAPVSPPPPPLVEGEGSQFKASTA